MPKLNGLEFVAKVREEDSTTPIIITTAHNDTDYLLKAVELRLVRYLIKPITSDKLQQALNMACKSLADKSVGLMKLDAQTQYDMLNKTLFVNQKPIKLTHNEVIFFDYLAKNYQRVVSYNEIENLIWAYEGMSMDALRSLVRGLRKKLGGDLIENVSGIGYRLIPQSCQAYHLCNVDSDCITKLGWEYMCAPISYHKTLWPEFDMHGNEKAKRSIRYFLKT